MKITWSGFMFGDPFHIRYLDNFSNSFVLLESSFMLTFQMAYLAFLYFSTLLWYWEPERLPTPFLISSILIFTLKMWSPSCSDCQTSLRYSKYHKYSRWHNCHYPWSPCVSQPWDKRNFFMFTDWNNSCLPLNFSSQNVFQVEQPW